METQDIISVITISISVISLLWAYATNRQLEKFKAVTALEKNYVESKLQQELRSIQELLQALRDGRLLIEKQIARNRKLKIETVNETLDRLEAKYTQSLLFLEKTDAKIGNSPLVIFVHEQKNAVRNLLEELQTKQSASARRKADMEKKLAKIKDGESKLIEKLSVINDSLFDIYKKKMKG